MAKKFKRSFKKKKGYKKFKSIRAFMPEGVMKRRVDSTCLIQMPLAGGLYTTVSNTIGIGAAVDVSFVSVLNVLNLDYLRMAQAYRQFRITGCKVSMSSVLPAAQTAVPTLYPLYIALTLGVNAGIGNLDAINADNVGVFYPTITTKQSKYWGIPRTMKAPVGFFTMDGWLTIDDSFTHNALGAFQFGQTAATLPTGDTLVFEAKFSIYTEWCVSSGGRA